MSATFPSVAAPGGDSAWRRRLSYVQDAVLVCFSGMFFYVHASHIVSDGSVSSLPFAVEQAILVVLFLSRRKSRMTSRRWQDWVIASIGGWLPLAVRPAAGGSFETFGFGLQVVGLTVVSVGFLTLGRSFGVVAANRGLKESGLYARIRHPIYLAHTITLVGFLLANVSLLNGVLVVVITCAQVLRIFAEERILRLSSDYRQYAERVRWRLVPGVF